MKRAYNTIIEKILSSKLVQHIKGDPHECEECGTVQLEKNMYGYDLYNTPWDKVPRVAWYCKVTPQEIKKGGSSLRCIESCEELMTDSSWADFRYFYCQGCYRYICEQNPNNGWHVQYRWMNDEMVCLQCYEERILTEGHEREEFENGHIPGMFFSSGNSEAYEAGYKLIIDSAHIMGKSTSEPFCKKAIELIDSGHKVIVGFESMAIGGLEGYISLFAKKEEEHKS